MTWRKTVAYWVLFAVLGGYYLAFEREPPPVAAPEVQREKLLAFFPDEVRAVALRRDGKSVRAERNENRWKVVAPEGVTVPSDLIAALLETMMERQESEIIEASPDEEDLRTFGLEPPAAVFEVELADGKTARVDIGRRNPTRTAVYARTSESPRILLAGLNVQYYSELLFQAAFPGAASGVAASSATKN